LLRAAISAVAIHVAARHGEKLTEPRPFLRSCGARSKGNNWSVGSYLIVGVQDNGQPGTAGPDQLNFSPGFSADPGCGPNLTADPVFSIVAGNYRVFSAP